MPARPWLGLGRGLAHGVLSMLLSLWDVRDKGETAPWQRAALRRRRALLSMMLLSVALAMGVLTHNDPPDSAAELAQTALFAMLFGWVSAGFYTALMGFWVLLQGGDRHAPRLPLAGAQALSREARTAILMPICNEDISTVFGGLRATCESLAATGQLGLFDIYVLSDTNKPEVQAAEVQAWRQLRDVLGDGDADGQGGRIFYRWRRIRTKRKAGNVADFCRRWGRNYRYMVVLDADSVMTGDCLVSLVRLMEATPKAGILQTAPRGCGIDTLHARAQAFVGRVTGRLFTSGLAYWQLGESHYWGHNAILRVEPFMRHCGLAKLEGRGGLSGEILSHDFVEAALMRRAGYEVWLVPELDGSFEQQPPNLVDELQRDRRWCQGNLQNARLIAEPGFKPVHRAMFITGAMSYVASPLWLLFIALGVWQGAHATGVAQGDASSAHAVLWWAVMGMLLLPRLLGIVNVVMRKEQAAFGGIRGLVVGGALEAVLSALQAPVRMAGHSLFVLCALTGLKLDWKSPSRAAAAVAWRDAASSFSWLALPLAVALCLILLTDPAGALRIAPVALPLLLAVPLAVFSSRETLGAALRRKRLLLTPEESKPAQALHRAWHYASRWLVALPAAMPASVPVLSAARPVRSFGAWPRGMAVAAAVLLLTIVPLPSNQPGGDMSLDTQLSSSDDANEAWRQIQLQRFSDMQTESLGPVKMRKASLNDGTAIKRRTKRGTNT